MNNFQVTDANHDLEKEEVDIVTGALKYKEKSIKQIMTRIEDVYMLQLTSVLNFETVSEIRDQGYSRIPVYDKSRTDIVHILFAKVSLPSIWILSLHNLSFDNFVGFTVTQDLNLIVIE